MKCRRCGAINAEYMKACGNCGTSLSSSDSGPVVDERFSQSSHYNGNEAPATEEHPEYDSSEATSTTLPQTMYRRLVVRIGSMRSWRDELGGLFAALMVTFGGWLALCLLTLVYGIGIVFPELETRSLPLSLYFMGWHSLTTLSGAILQGWYLFLVYAIIVSAVWTTRKSWHRFKQEVTGEGEAKNHSPFFEICGLMFAMFFIIKIIVFALEESGYSPTNPSESWEEWELLFVSAHASVWEELCTRVLLIGLPLILVDMALKRGRKPWRYLTGGEIGIGRAEVFLIIVSAVVFGSSHIELWGSWRMLDTGLAGVALGYLFLRYGLAVSIILHFSVNYFDAPVLVSDSAGVILLLFVGSLLWFCLGLVFAVYYMTRVVDYALGR